MANNYMPYQGAIDSEMSRKHKETDGKIAKDKAKTKLLAGLTRSVTGGGFRRVIGSKKKEDEYLS